MHVVQEYKVDPRGNIQDGAGDPEGEKVAQSPGVIVLEAQVLVSPEEQKEEPGVEILQKGLRHTDLPGGAHHQLHQEQIPF